MTRTLVVVTLALLFGFGAGAPARADGDGSVRVEVSNLKNRAGNLRCALYASEQGFPETGGLQVQSTPLSSGAASCVFSNVPPGTYAVSVHHDENGDGKLNRDFLGAPSEGYGVSNNRTYALSAPKWRESQFQLAAGEARTLSVVLRN